MDKLKKEYQLLRKAFESSERYEWLVPTKKTLYYLPPVLYSGSTGYYLAIMILKKDGEERIIMNYCRSEDGECATACGKGMSCDRPKDPKGLEKALLSLAKEVKATFYIKANRALAKTFIEEIYQ